MTEADPRSSQPAVRMRHDRGGFVFEPTPAVAASRRRSRYLDCPVCQADHAQYLFHRTGVRFVRCGNCGLVYVSPASETGPNWFDIAKLGQHERPDDRALCVADFDDLLRRFARDFARVQGRPLRKTVLIGRFLREFADTQTAARAGRAPRPRGDARRVPRPSRRVAPRLGQGPPRQGCRHRHPERGPRGLQRRRRRPASAAHRPLVARVRLDRGDLLRTARRSLRPFSGVTGRPSSTSRRRSSTRRTSPH